MGINDLEVYQLSMTLGENVWQVVAHWDYFAKDTVGKQVVRSADSVAANISEGFGRYHFKENIHFCYIARGSLLETRTWLDKAKRRGLIKEDIYQTFDSHINTLGRKLNAYIKSIGKSAGGSTYNASEPVIDYKLTHQATEIDWDIVFPMPNDQ